MSQKNNCNIFLSYFSVPCPQLTDPAFGSVQIEGSTASYVCNEGYQVTPPDMITRKCFNGQWDGQDPECQSKLYLQIQIQGWACSGMVIFIILQCFKIRATNMHPPIISERCSLSLIQQALCRSVSIPCFSN